MVCVSLGRGTGRQRGVWDGWEQKEKLMKRRRWSSTGSYDESASGYAMNRVIGGVGESPESRWWWKAEELAEARLSLVFKGRLHLTALFGSRLLFALFSL